MDNQYLLRVYGDLTDKFENDMFVLNTKWSVKMFLEGLKNKIDQEDDAVEVYLIEHSKLSLVWGFWGWHFEPKLDQGYKFIETQNEERVELIFRFANE